MLKEMPYVYAVYKEHGFSKAAQYLHVTQPVVSTMVKRAEEEFHAPIFDRKTLPVSLTSAGKIYIQAIEQILSIQDETLSLFNTPADDLKLQIRIGASSLFCTHILPPVIKKFQETAKNIKVYWKEGSNIELLKLLKSGNLDFVLEPDDFDNTVFDFIPWCQEYLILAVPALDQINNALSKYRYTCRDIQNGRHLKHLHPHVSLKLFAEKPFVFLKDGNDTALRGMLVCKRAGFEPHITMKVDQLMTAYNLAREGYGSTFIPDNMPQLENADDKLFFYTVDSPLMSRTVKLYSCKNYSRPAPAEMFWNYVQRSKSLN